MRNWEEFREWRRLFPRSFVEHRFSRGRYLKRVSWMHPSSLRTPGKASPTRPPGDASTWRRGRGTSERSSGSISSGSLTALHLRPGFPGNVFSRADDLRWSDRGRLRVAEGPTQGSGPPQLLVASPPAGLHVQFWSLDFKVSANNKLTVQQAFGFFPS